MKRLAEMAGLSQQMVSYVERGMRMPTLDTLLRLTSALEVELGQAINKASSDGKKLGKKRCPTPSQSR